MNLKNNKKDIILTDNEGATLGDKTLNSNVLLIGNAGMGKSFNYFLPNILQANTSFVINDTYGAMYKQTKDFLTQNGYCIRVLNLSELEYSDKYNPFEYCYNNGYLDKNAVTDMVASMLTVPDGFTGNSYIARNLINDSMRLLVSAICMYLIETQDKEKHNFENVMELLSKPLSELDKIITKPDGKLKVLSIKTYMQFRKTKLSSDIKTATYKRMQEIFTDEFLKATKYDSIDIERINDRKTAVFIISSPSSSHSFLANILISQIYTILLSKENAEIPTHFMLDNFSNIPKLERVSVYFSICRIKKINTSIAVQTIGQLKALYPNWMELVANCDNQLFFGNCDVETLNYINSSGDINLKKINFKECVLLQRGRTAVYDLKYDIAKHKNYKYLSK